MGVSSVQNHEQEDENETTSWSETENCTGKYTILLGWPESDESHSWLLTEPSESLRANLLCILFNQSLKLQTR